MATAENTLIVIPTYWTWPSTESHRPVAAAYDHPSPLDGQSTLPPLLEDLAAQHASGLHVLILTGLGHPGLGEAASGHVRDMLKPYRGRLELHLCDAVAYERLKDIIRATAPQAELLHLSSYAGIRNLQLLVPHVLGAEVVVALDDDERVGPGYAERALRYVGGAVDGESVLGLAGPYLQGDGSVLLNELPPTGNVLRDKARHINSAMRVLASGKAGLVPSPMALGGNMVFHRDLFARVCFDPGITRGEDIDYLINARLQGIRWWFDPELNVLHLPPRHYEASSTKGRNCGCTEWCDRRGLSRIQVPCLPKIWKNRPLPLCGRMQHRRLRGDWEIRRPSCNRPARMPRVTHRIMMLVSMPGVS